MADKLRKEEVNYRDSTDGKRRCGECSMYEAGLKCSLVAGRITPRSVCDRWEKR